MIEGETSVWPSDDDFRKAIEMSPAYQKLKRSRIRMLLEAIEAALHDGKTERIEIHDDLTVEHIIPQRWEENWPLSEDTAEAREMREVLVHSFGNLTLVTEKLNPSKSNADWSKKRPALQQHSALTLNRMLLANEIWDEETIRGRSKLIADLALGIWPRKTA